MCDYLIVGKLGSAGCALAARLSADPTWRRTCSKQARVTMLKR